MKSACFTVGLALALAALPHTCQGQTALDWKLKAGEKYDLHVLQQTNSTVTVVNKTVKTAIEIALDSTWSVESVSEGAAKIRQTIARVQVKVQAADSPLVAYDTAASEKPSGAARDLAAAVGPLVDPQSSLLLTMTDRGEIISVEWSPRLAELWNAGQAGAGDRKESPAKESLDALLKQPLAILPEKAVAKGDKWDTSRELHTPSGKFTQKVEYTYAGRRDSVAGAADAISFAAFLTPAAQGKAKIKEQSQTGTILFDGQAGRLRSSEQSQRLVTETPYRDATITVVVESQVTRTLTPQ